MSRALRKMIDAAQRILVFSGAGMSTDSGVPDFRSRGGIWDRIDPRVLSRDAAEGDAQARRDLWSALGAIAETCRGAAPNAGHHAVVRLEAAGKLEAVVTQNVDGLHQAAGNDARRVIELHGALRDALCLKCGARESLPAALVRALAADAAPACLGCGGPLRPDTVLFGDPLPMNAWHRARNAALVADLCLVLGSSLAVHPAAELPELAKRSGARLAIVTLSLTPLDDLADLCLHSPLAEAFVPAVR